MKYIRKVILENFQSHKNSTIEFDNQLNVIVGPSDSGKTAILRGIKWALYNEPSGDYFIKEGENHTSVTLVFSDLTKIKRYRSKSKNSYHLYDSNNNETIFEGFGTNVPQEIIDATGINKIFLDNNYSSAINLSDQLEGAFLLSDRGSIRANSIGRLVGANIIDDSLRETLKDIRSLSSNKKYIDNKVIGLKEELKEYNYLEGLRDKVNNLDKLRDLISEKNETQIKLNKLLDQLRILKDEKKDIYLYVDQLKHIDQLDSIINNIELGLNNYKYLSNHKKKFSIISSDIKKHSHLVTSLKDLGVVESNSNEISIKLDLKTKMKKTKTILDTNIREVNEWSHTLKGLDNLDRLNSLINHINNNHDKLIELKSLNTKMTSLKNSLMIGKEYLANLEEIREAATIYNTINDKYILLKQLQDLLVKYNINEKELDKTRVYLNKIKQEFIGNLDKYKALLINQETCPFCFSQIDNHKIEHIIDHYN